MRHISLIVAAGFLAACGSANDTDSALSSTGSVTMSGIEISAGEALSASCSGCHSALPETSMGPLSGRSASALASAINSYRTDPDGTTVMHRIARGYSEADVEAISSYLSGGDE